MVQKLFKLDSRSRFMKKRVQMFILPPIVFPLMIFYAFFYSHMYSFENTLGIVVFVFVSVMWLYSIYNIFVIFKMNGLLKGKIMSDIEMKVKRANFDMTDEEQIVKEIFNLMLSVVTNSNARVSGVNNIPTTNPDGDTVRITGKYIIVHKGNYGKVVKDMIYPYEFSKITEVGRTESYLNGDMFTIILYNAFDIKVTEIELNINRHDLKDIVDQINVALWVEKKIELPMVKSEE